MKQYYIYMLASRNNRALYTGVTSDLEKRLYEHKNGITGGFARKYHCEKLVHYEVFNDPENAIAREKTIKGWVRRKKDTLIEKANPNWQDLSLEWQLDPSSDIRLPHDDISQKSEEPLSSVEWDRYQRQLALPDITAEDQIRLKQTRILYVGAGGLGAAALPYLAAAGIGAITICDHDDISLANLHRQTVYKTEETGNNKANAMAAYLRALNPHTDIQSIHEKFSGDLDAGDFDLILDGSDNFETKDALNALSIRTQTPLIMASVNQFEGQAGIFTGYYADAPCYRCLFPELPSDARNCNEAGILGTSAGLAGLYQAHLALCYILRIGDIDIGTILTMDFKTMRMQKLTLEKEANCPHCTHDGAAKPKRNETMTPELVTREDLQKQDHLIVDVRTHEEVAADPIEGALHMELQTIPARYNELPEDKLLAFVCAANFRSVQAAEFMAAMGRSNVCVLDKFSL